MSIILTGIIKPVYTDTADNPITLSEDRSEYFRYEINYNMTRSQIIDYLTRKELAEKSTNEDLGAKYILNLNPPFDRKIDASIAESWQKLNSNEKNNLRYDWFVKQRKTISTRDICNYIHISDLIQRARTAEQKFLKRQPRVKIAFENVSPDSQFLAAVEKIAIAPDFRIQKPAAPAEPEVTEIKITKKKYVSSAAKKNKPVRTKKKNLNAKSAKQKKVKKEAVTETAQKTKENEAQLTGLRPRKLNVEEMKTELSKEKKVVEPDNTFNTQIENLQTKISNLRKQLNNTAVEIDGLRNNKTKKTGGEE